jgi:hypothetical protein
MRDSNTCPPTFGKKFEKPFDEGIKVKAFTPSLFRREISGGARKILGFLQLYISMPDNLFESIIDYAVRIHELEHIIQIHTTGTGHADSYIWPSFAQDRYHLELGAMRSEGTFLLLFPKHIIQKSIDAGFSPAQPQSRTRQLGLRMLTNALITKDARNYLQLNWDQGRYSLRRLQRFQAMSYAVFPGGVIPFLILAHIFGW